MADPSSDESPAKSALDRSGSGEISPATRNKKRGLLSRMWRVVFGGRSEDYEKKLKHLSKEEASVHSRMKRRALRTRKAARNIIVFSAILEVAAVALAIVTVRASHLNWTMKIVRSLPVILSPGLSFVIYTTLVRVTRMLDRKDEKTLERLRAERKEKLDELKELTNYYSTQELIQRYDLDPAAKAAAASVLASKLGADSGLKVHLGDESISNPQSARSNDVELVQSGGLRNRRHRHQRSNSTGSSEAPKSTIGASNEPGADGENDLNQSQVVVEHHRGSSAGDGGWLARIASLLVGEDPSQCFALICGYCLRHNGLARREDFPHITYYCPHCHALNTSRQPGEHDSASTSGMASTPTSYDGSLVRNLSNASSASGGGEVRTNIAAASQDHPVGSAE
ncbi:uncharacterized protein M6B38_162790 [Iris pallida]|uniref:Lunapark zinc ribbon domain-containing protein n=1 Tax=Iris pallida TaxID=29817 RepID=A0AAX6F0L4_IRIPA|nr:uncharacterized protein M6B38_162790 [Iris pallida]